ncbi:DUF2177 family protein [Propioniciclava tarda]|uniref:DUF2177 family protein n=1 Tax=Propioniciclava tarda TaxID=433330 RepID=A0A4Q9KIL5_PROTD|nr:DUF2177 family protein [Propioniciclava tarda]TBT94236.1 DUF2177 family protein [Propioniciclava tarda]SMO75215.1 Uncharacterized membrane protein [Propioniciclava tarda]
MSDSVRRWGVAYLLAAATFAALDVVWISLVAGQQYRSQIPQLMADSPNGAAAGLFYALFVCGIVAFGVRPHDPDASLASRAASGALFGLLAYATWGLTGVAVLKGFPWGLALLDMAWGAVASGVVTAVTATILGRLKALGSGAN